jgi:hypothetical protein
MIAQLASWRGVRSDDVDGILKSAQDRAEHDPQVVPLFY